MDQHVQVWYARRSELVRDNGGQARYVLSWKGNRRECHFESERRAMISEQLAARGLRDERVLAVMGEIPREVFVDEQMRGFAYEDRALGIAEKQTISQPYMVAAMTEALRLTPDNRVLEIGTGSGYQAAVLSRLCREVYTVDRIASLSQTATMRLSALGCLNISYRVGDGSVGWAEEAPFDRIIVTAGRR